MLYNIEITAKTVRNKDELVEKLYTFLRAYVPTRLIYENKDSINDCIQDTIMFILNRLDELEVEIRAVNPIQLITFNYEKWIYNRARSYTSYWIKRKNNDRKREREYIENAIYFTTHEPDTFTPEDILYDLLESIALSYKLNENDTKFLLKTMETMLVNVGYTPTTRYEDLEIKEEIKHLVLIAYAAVDEYIYESGLIEVE